MDTLLTADDLFDIRDEMNDLATKIDNFRIAYSDTISARLFSDLEKWSRSIKDGVFELTGKALKQLNTDLQEPAENIKKAINKLKDALRTVEDFNNVVGYIADIINIFGVIVTAVSQGLNPASIASAFNSLENLFSVA